MCLCIYVCVRMFSKTAERIWASDGSIDSSRPGGCFRRFGSGVTSAAALAAPRGRAACHWSGRTGYFWIPRDVTSPIRLFPPVETAAGGGRGRGSFFKNVQIYNFFFFRHIYSVFALPPSSACVAQVVQRVTSKREVRGSSPGPFFSNFLSSIYIFSAHI